MATKDSNEEVEKTESKAPESDYFKDEDVSFSFFFFLMSGGLLLVTLWAFWDDEYSRRGYKDYQTKYFKAEYTRAENSWKEKNKQIKDKENELASILSQENERLESSSEFQELLEKTREAKIHLDEEVEHRKFALSRLDEYYYYYKKAQHENRNFDVELARVHETEEEIKEFDKVIEGLQEKYDKLESQVLARKAKIGKLEKELRSLTNERDNLNRRMDFYKPFPLFWRPAEIKQTVITGYGKNNFSEIIYKVDRCMTCHISYNDDYYKEYSEPLKTHPDRELLIGKHPPESTGCTWCHKGQGPATAPPEHAHGSHHEMDQTVGINEPILLGKFMQSNCNNCHAEVVDLQGAPLLSKGKRLFLKLGCHGCHLVEGYQNEEKVGPSLRRIGSKVNSSWMYRWIRKPREYLPNTRMPDFGLNEKDAMAITAYLIDASDKEYDYAESFKSGDPEKGKEEFETVGCLACHKLKGKGEEHAPDLSNIGKKVGKTWLYNWVLNPSHYNSSSKMPNLRLKKQQAADIAAYLIQFGKPTKIKNIDKMVASKKLIEYGESLVRRRGCFACHDIKGMEKEGRIAPELSSFGNKQVLTLEFGDSHVARTWESWVYNKLKKPTTYRTERILDKMPNFHLADDEIQALMVLLKGLNGIKIPHEYKRNYSKNEKIIERGRRIVSKYNCKGCHHIEGEGGVIQKYISATFQYPPPLELDSYHVGERIKPSWLYSFLKNPTPVRTWLKVKMPTFNFTDEEVQALTSYFVALSPEEVPFEAGLNVAKAKENVENGVRMVNYMECGNCHDDGAKGIEFSIASNRLRSNWVPKWLKFTQNLIPWTKMPSHWPQSLDGSFSPLNKYDLLNTFQEGKVDKQVGLIRDYIMAYNSPDYDTSLSLGESDEDEEEEEEEDEDF